MKLKILVFCDPGIDDTIALIYALQHPKIEVVGIVAEYGNTTRKFAFRNIEYLLTLVDKEHIPVIAGAERALSGETPVIQPTIHGDYGLGPFTPPNSEEGLRENFCELLPLLREANDDLTIVTLGRLTTLATLFLLYPNLMSTIKNYHVMGGAFFVPGNVTPVAEANVYGDPVAASIVIKYAKNVTLFPLNITNHVFITPELAEQLNVEGREDILYPILDFYYTFYQSQQPDIPGSPIHDLIPILALTKPHWFTYENKLLHVQKEPGIARGLTLADMRPYEVLPNGPIQRVAIKMDDTEFEDHLIDTLA
ncbi:nucleoside hydrolase [Bacillus sp. FJAT-45037]|uniref:nucleoside hydrolase n=1 Tax=Bacillus sp. FJAT-45037 TaxID=2011007 RepID=UPI000C241E97|nr:nucleoside hydrolase [Bacillus sp. FJAT-45037]